MVPVWDTEENIRLARVVNNAYTRHTEGNPPFESTKRLRQSTPGLTLLSPETIFAILAYWFCVFFAVVIFFGFCFDRA
ncbi:uncharacterized protein LY89DRAFT_63756 [Mollisia scopiformis]|uniref:Uncharacterized protein n=1 Tax=Mollisia scopiformis TaxID=149040 RepID=A0A194X999_MOLSC|nr:uncharacterized protein LY89DRAFT_63756 [Mollisia scopiformis]KUJ16746.1 hypothetical protein LY89DRAFT_63756 [Mollisia scopiformis]